MTEAILGSVDTFSGSTSTWRKVRYSFSTWGSQTAYAGRLDRGVGMNRR
jgi:hypothetical protein